mmetsp:Transcript_387/g.1348  ORF Transcript_387/g.1348 Transcript_387/m.1348 type:complete len:337 (+) Transcript_387:70-1080(+)
MPRGIGPIGCRPRSPPDDATRVRRIPDLRGSDGGDRPGCARGRYGRSFAGGSWARTRAWRAMHATRAPPPCRRPGRQVVRARKEGDGGAKDVVERLFARAFGEEALRDTSPMGMKRMDVNTCPEAYGPAAKEEVAAPLEGDGAMAKLVRPLLAKTQLEKRGLQLAYDASTHGWNADAFHQCVDGRGPAVVVAKTSHGTVCGGYNPKGWIGLGDNRASRAAFLFCIQQEESGRISWEKLQKVGGDALAVCDQSDCGPVFGADALAIRLREPNEREAKCRLGAYYEKRADGSRNLFANEEKARGGGGKAELVSLHVLVAEGKGEEWELDGIVWKTRLE